MEVDYDEYNKQARQEIIDSGSYFEMDLLVPNVDLNEMLKERAMRVIPISKEKCHNCSCATIAVAALSLDSLKEALLEKNLKAKILYECFKEGADTHILSVDVDKEDYKDE